MQRSVPPENKNWLVLSLSPPNKSKQQWHQGQQWLSGSQGTTGDGHCQGMVMLLNAEVVGVAETQSWKCSFLPPLAEMKASWDGWHMAGESPPPPFCHAQASHPITGLRYTTSLAHSRFCLLRMKSWMLTYCPQQFPSSRCWAGRREQAVTPAGLGPVIPASPRCVTLHI